MRLIEELKLKVFMYNIYRIKSNCLLKVGGASWSFSSPPIIKSTNGSVNFIIT